MEEFNNQGIMPLGDISPDLAYSKRILALLLALDTAFINGRYNDQLPIISTLYQELASRESPEEMIKEYGKLVEKTNVSLVKYHKANSRGSKKTNHWLREVNNYLIEIGLLLRKESLKQLHKLRKD